mmetsp:Transcript_92581/g.261505  ORF Transcript_92581/g.261505 Transcript_92581/m.261505 type:complete len:129 (-) Transcript_92581:99-485(-)
MAFSLRRPRPLPGALLVVAAMIALKTLGSTFVAAPLAGFSAAKAHTQTAELAEHGFSSVGRSAPQVAMLSAAWLVASPLPAGAVSEAVQSLPVFSLPGWGDPMIENLYVVLLVVVGSLAVGGLIIYLE